MPVQPNGRKLLMRVQTEADVHALFEKALSLSQTSGILTRERYRADIEDHFYYVGTICPEYFRPLQYEAITLPGKRLTFFNFSFATWLYLLQDAEESCVEQLMQRLLRPDRDCPPFILEAMLAAIGTPAALAAMGEYTEKTHQPNAFRDYGFWLPGKGKSAEPRFSRRRHALHFQPVDASLSLYELERRPHPVGLPVSFIAEKPAQEAITWHYLTLDLAQIAGIPQTSIARIHLVSPPYSGGWTIFCAVSPQNLYTQADLRLSSFKGTEIKGTEMSKTFQEQAIARQNEGKGELHLLPYDDRLVYCNGHTQLTPGVHGDVGGPPLGLAELPCCPICKKLMFHICTIASTLREYGDGFRSLFFCKDCMQTASQAMEWN